MAKIKKGILPRDEIKKITTGLFFAQFLDGGMSGGQLDNKLKNNTKSFQVAHNTESFQSQSWPP